MAAAAAAVAQAAILFTSDFWESSQYKEWSVRGKTTFNQLMLIIDVYIWSVPATI